MNIGRYRFAPPWWGVLLFVVVAGLLCALGRWQIERGQLKERLAAIQNAAQQAGPTLMTAEQAASTGNDRATDLVFGRRYFVEGHFDTAHQILLNDQVNANRIGYRVWTPLLLENGIRVMVDRGWVARPRRDEPPDPAAPKKPVRVLGFWRSFPQPGLRMGDSNSCDATTWPRALNFPDAATVRCQYHASVANGLLLLSPKDPSGFVRDWDEDLVGISSLRHYAYASQWFLMAFVVAIIFLIVNSQRRE